MPVRLPRIGITCTTASIVEETGHVVAVDAMPVEFGEVLVKCGAVPVGIPLSLRSDILRELMRSLDGVVLTGGPDVGIRTDGCADQQRQSVDQRKDTVEWQICGLALSCGVPLLGICRGLQLVNVYLGGTLYNDIVTECHSTVPHLTKPEETAARHVIRIAPASKLSTIFQGTAGEVNSYHHQAVRQVAPGLRATAWAEDGIVEGVESVIYRSFLGVQFHPEIDYAEDEPSTRIFEWLVAEAERFVALKEGNAQGSFSEERVG